MANGSGKVVPFHVAGKGGVDERSSMSGQRIMALIQARAGSKGVPGKNIRPLGGHAMIAYSIAAARLCPEIGRVIVSTDGPAIADIARCYGAEVPFLRPSKYATDAATDAEVIRHALDWLATNEGYEPDLLVQLRPTTPLREPSILSRAIERLSGDESATSLRSAHEVAEPPQKMFVLDGGYWTGLFPAEKREEYFHLPRQAFPTAYYPNGYVDILKPSYIRAATNGSIYGGRILAFTTAIAPEVDIPEDLSYLEYLIERLGHPLRNHLDAHFPEARVNRRAHR